MMRLVLALVCVALVTLGMARTATASDAAQEFVSDLADKALEIVKAESASSGAEQRSSFSSLLDENFDMRGIAQFLVGRYWRQASESERDAYFKAFHDSIVNTYTNRFGDYSGQELKVTGDREDGRFTLVMSEIVAPGGQAQPIKVDWRLLPAGSSFKVVDVVIEGVSMSVTQRQEYTALIQSKGGKLAALTEALEEKNKRIAK